MSRSTGGLTRREQQKRTRAALIVAASTLFARDGFEGTSVQAIASEAGFTRGAFYAHFADKHEILESVIAERDALDRLRLMDLLEAGQISQQEMSKRITEFQQDDIPVTALRLEVLRQGLNSGVFAELLRTHRRAEVEGFQSLLDRVSPHLPLREGIHAHAAAQLIAAVLDGVSLAAAVDDSVDIAAIWEALVLALTEPQ